MSNLFKPTKEHVKNMANVLAKAFYDYPLFVWVIPDANGRQKKLHYGFAGILRYGLKYGEVYATSNNFEGVIIYLHSSSGSMTTWRWLQCGLLKVLFKWGRTNLNRWSSIGESTELFRKKNAPNPHVYLLTIGVDPNFQSKGYGSQLIKSGLERLDQIHTPCYLETFKYKNILLYKHFGFDLLDEFIVPNTDLTLFSMLRQPSNS